MLSFSEVHIDNTHIDAALAGPGSPPSDLRNLGEYRFLRRLGEGGMGAVYLGLVSALASKWPSRRWPTI